MQPRLIPSSIVQVKRASTWKYSHPQAAQSVVFAQPGLFRAAARLPDRAGGMVPAHGAQHAGVAKRPNSHLRSPSFLVPRHAAARHARGSSEASSRWSPWSHCSAVVWSGPASASDSVATCNPPCPPRRLLHRQGPPPLSPPPLPPLMRGARVEPGRSQGGDGALSGSECCCRECRSDQVTWAAAGAHRSVRPL